ncbi:RNA polymerase II-associated protein rba50 [Zancudomyces culisetae]|uniref:RNA polymerase II-associated protein rba50 n=1 Tax=Zancudomyces culisetae TaxID=1213189 RepID=A0A1R1PXC1_ZANCU|nr:RNA polymerase II-associated protein rba50 [Zancudomyces culisetae]|eukprot:OMH85630.1 RNA polymerase II-associated protein rba50 [Zancudomyces culisetae]
MEFNDERQYTRVSVRQKLNSESDDYLERLQQEFLSEKKINPAAKVISKKNEPNLDEKDGERLKSNMMESMRNVDEIGGEPAAKLIIGKPPPILAEGTGNAQIPQKHEHNLINTKKPASNPVKSHGKSEQECEMQQDSNEKPANPGKKKLSLFAQKRLLEKQKRENGNSDPGIEKHGVLKQHVKSFQGFPEVHKDQASFSKKISSVDSQGAICDDNTSKILQMSKGEIDNAYSEIQGVLSEKSIEFLKNRNKKKESCTDELVDIKLGEKAKKVTINEEKNETIKHAPTEEDPANLEEFYKKVLQVGYQNDIAEEKKLEWLMNQSQAKTPTERVLENIKSQSERAARVMKDIIAGGETSDPLLDDPASHLRFDFAGSIVDVLDEIPTSHGLHHHGEDPDDAGYTIPELLHLARSTVPSQRAIAIKTLGNIIHKLNVGAFDSVYQRAIYSCWLEWEGHLYFSAGWGDSHGTVRAESIFSTWTWVVEFSRSHVLRRLESTQGSDFSPDVVACGDIVTRTHEALSKLLSPSFLKSAMDVLSDPTSSGLHKLVYEVIVQLYKGSDDFALIIKNQKNLCYVLESKYAPFL